MNARDYNYALIGNGKTYKGRLQEVRQHARTLANEITQGEFQDTLVAYAPPVPLLASVADVFGRNSETSVELASQAISWKRHGMDTGGAPADSLRDLGVRIVIVNHSEQKAYLHYTPEYDKFISLQIANALACDLNIVLCCGEEKGDHRADRPDQLQRDIHGGLARLSARQRAHVKERLVIAYEPGGVIGTGKTAPIRQIALAFEEINQILKGLCLDGQIPLIYGGGVNACNLKELHHGLRSETDVFGYLVGEASTRADEFVEMARRLSDSTKVRGSHVSFSAIQLGMQEELDVVAPSADPVGEIRPVGRTRIAIVGFGEIGAAIAIACAQDPGQSADVVQIFNKHISPEDGWARLVQSRYIDRSDVSFGEEDGGAYIRILDQMAELTPHDSMEDAARRLNDIDVVVFTVGDFTKDPAFMRPFLQDGRARVVLVTCATPAADLAMVPGFNHSVFNEHQHKIVALGSCTGNATVPILSVIEELLGEGAIRGLYAVAPHSKTNTQEIGVKGADPKREGILGNLIPTSTGLSKLLQEPGFFEFMSESVEAVSVRAPTEDASLLCMAVDVEGAEGISTADVRAAFRDASGSSRWRGILGVDQARGTRLFWKDSHACVVYEPYVKLLPKYLKDGKRSPLSTVAVMAAYSNVFGYSCQVLRAIKAFGLGRETSARQYVRKNHPEMVQL